jgi:hypothetical protein
VRTLPSRAPLPPPTPEGEIITLPNQADEPMKSGLIYQQLYLETGDLS